MVRSDVSYAYVTGPAQHQLALARIKLAAAAKRARKVRR